MIGTIHTWAFIIKNVQGTRGKHLMWVLTLHMNSIILGFVVPINLTDIRILLLFLFFHFMIQDYFICKEISLGHEDTYNE